MVLAAFLRLFFRLLYHQFAWTYDFVAYCVSLGMWKSWVLSALPYLKGPRVLEIGHGPGHLLRALSNTGMKPSGLDESLWMGKLALKNLRGTTTTPQLLNGYAQSIPVKSRSFDQVVATFPAEFIFEKEALLEIRRVLDDAGSLVILPLAWITGNRPLERLARFLFRTTNQAPAWNEGFLQPFTAAGFRAQVEFIELERSTIALIQAFKLA